MDPVGRSQPIDHVVRAELAFGRKQHRQNGAPNVKISDELDG
jgi:hypothetical protein